MCHAMKLLALTLALTAIVGIVHGTEISSPVCGDHSWTPYKDEKCVKLFKSFATQRQAQEICHQHVSSLVAIRSAAEQLFLNEYVFNSSMGNSVWIGAERRSNSETEFNWIDGSPVNGFTNWAVGSPTNNVGRPCVQMQSINSMQLSLSDMEWNDISCTGGSWFICQKLQTWPIEKLQRAVLANRRDMQDVLEILQDLQDLKDIQATLQELQASSRDQQENLQDLQSSSREQLAALHELQASSRDQQATLQDLQASSRDQQANLQELQANFLDLQESSRDQEASLQALEASSRDQQANLQVLQANPVPIGFIYVQLSGQSDPGTIWTTVTWTDVTSQYAGLFFRAEGGGSAP